ncbi:hypothetical protein FHS43_001069 [Streptosporangium becharense]|uniref:Uncharacterized protein n=1 Tax=Streptosporangium becharense TaxID=1816182 RepID=A0A7W9MFM6_9ACTN|nr:hypothetical protein [Streptosporangium becharense]MBB2909823.1 hypothetical protein [Streptosporangium becharense]MBB5819222.1 hypothetical protein [Streptosporangium becharense]
MTDSNPFKDLSGVSETGPDALQRATNLKREEQLRTVADLGLATPEQLESNPKVRDLTINDLNDLAAEFSGIPTNNRRVAELTLDDLQDLEGVFFEFKRAVGRDLVTRGASVSSVDVSCCCCTPCCSCAAADMSHTGS